MEIERSLPCRSCPDGLREEAARIAEGFNKSAAQDIRELSVRFPHDPCETCEGKGVATYDLELSLRGRFVRGTPDRGPSYADGGVQGEPDHYEELCASVVTPGFEDVDPDLTEEEIDRAYEELMAAHTETREFRFPRRRIR